MAVITIVHPCQPRYSPRNDNDSVTNVAAALIVLAVMSAVGPVCTLRLVTNYGAATHPAPVVIWCWVRISRDGSVRADDRFFTESV